jgi:hypothetical protein
VAGRCKSCDSKTDDACLAGAPAGRQGGDGHG